MNTVNLIGRTTADIELRVTQSGKSVASFSLAVRKNENKTSFIPCVAWGQMAELLANHVKKGQRIGVVGSLDQRTYDRKDGTKASVVEVECRMIEFLERKEATQSTSDFKPIEASEDDLPF